jgi:maleylacetoacetate isomerase
MKLYTSHQSTGAYRVRIALNLKAIAYEPEFIALDRETGTDRSPEYLSLNPQGMVPTLIDGQRVYRKSLAILEYLEESYPSPSILPGSNRDRERIRSLSQVMVTDTSPLVSPRVLSHLREELGLGKGARKEWVRHWTAQSLEALESLMVDNPATSRYCHGDVVTMADICLVSQVYGLVQQGWDLSAYPTIDRIYHNGMDLPAFADAAPRLQPDALAAAR